MDPWNLLFVSEFLRFSWTNESCAHGDQALICMTDSVSPSLWPSRTRPHSAHLDHSENSANLVFQLNF